MVSAQRGVRGIIVRYLDRLRFPYLLALTAGLFLLDLVFPDVIPYVDEILLGLATLVWARLKRREGAAPRAEAELR